MPTKITVRSERSESRATRRPQAGALLTVILVGSKPERPEDGPLVGVGRPGHAPGCLENMAWLCGDVRDLGLSVVAVREDAFAAQLVGVGHGCQRAWPPTSSV